MASTLWLSLCLVLFAYNLMDLMNDRHQLSYKIVEQGDVLFDEDHDLNYLACTPFKRIKDENLLTYEPVTKNVSVRSFLDLSIITIEHRLNRQFKLIVNGEIIRSATGLFRSNESLIFNGHVCFPTDKSVLENGEMDRNLFNGFLQIYAIQSIFIYSKEKQPNFYERA